MQTTMSVSHGGCRGGASRSRRRRTGTASTRSTIRSTSTGCSRRSARVNSARSDAASATSIPTTVRTARRLLSGGEGTACCDRGRGARGRSGRRNVGRCVLTEPTGNGLANGPPCFGNMAIGFGPSAEGHDAHVLAVAGRSSPPPVVSRHTLRSRRARGLQQFILGARQLRGLTAVRACSPLAIHAILAAVDYPYLAGLYAAKCVSKRRMKRKGGW